MHFFFFTFALLISLVLGQTGTVVDDDGQTVVEVVTTNARGVRTTSTISTILDTPTQATQNQGPIGAPPRTTQEGTPFLPTPFQYTTTIGGVKTVVQDTFTPTLGFPSTVPTQIPATGTILGYSEWLAQYGATATNSASSPLRWPAERMWGMALGILGGLAGGVFLVGL